MFTSKPTKTLPYSLRIKPMLVAMKPGDAIRIPAEKTCRMQVWTAINRLNKATGWKEYEYTPIISATGKKSFFVKRHAMQATPPDSVGTPISEAQASQEARANQSPQQSHCDDQ